MIIEPGSIRHRRAQRRSNAGSSVRGRPLARHVRTWLGVAAVLSGCDVLGPDGDAGQPRVDVYRDRFAYRSASYASLSELRIALAASRESPVAVVVHDCLEAAELVAVLDLVRVHGGDFDVVLPEHCPPAAEGR